MNRSGKIKCISLNVRGINSPIKRKKVLTYLKKQHTDIAFIQETHLTHIEHLKLRREWVGHVFFSSFSSNARGVALLINKNLRFQLKSKEQDKYGRFVLIDCIINTTRVILVSLSGPNLDDPQFFNDLILKLAEFDAPYIMGGDYNLVLNPLMDRSNSKTDALTKSAKALTQGMKELRLGDVWRVRNPTIKDYSCYSNVHNTYSRIDMFLISNSFLPQIKLCSYLAATISDHNPIQMELELCQSEPYTPTWRFQKYLLKDPEFISFMNTKIDIYLDANLNSASDSDIWEALKAFMRGHTISYVSYKNKQKKEQLTELEKEIRDLEIDHSRTKQAEILGTLKQKRILYDNLCTSKAEAAMARTNYHYYEFGNKTSKLLAWQIKKKDNEKFIQSIKTEDGRQLENVNDINLEFTKYYQSLYNSDLDDTGIKQYLSQLPLPEIKKTDKDILEREITEDEVLLAVNSLQNNKAPGPDGFLIEYFKTFSNKLLIPLTNMIKKALEKEILPPSLRLATITLLPKPGKDPQMCGNYRPLSLLNSDYKVLSKIIASRLEPVIPTIIHADQTGFVKNRQGADNLRRLFLTMNIAKRENLPLVILSMDAEKAFDRIEPAFLFETMRAMNFGETFIKYVRTLFNGPQSQIVTNGILSNPFTLFRGCRQGCPSSPILFSIAIEPLAIAIRTDSSIIGVKIGTEEHKLALYADDLLVFITQPLKTFPSLLACFNAYSAISGYKINYTKSEAYPINMTKQEIKLLPGSFKWCFDGFTYLGIYRTVSEN